MRLSLKMVQTAFSQPMQEFIVALARNQTRQTVDDLALAGITDNSTGVAANALVVVPLQTSRVSPSGANLAPRAGFNAAIGKVNDAIAVLADYLSTSAAALGIDNFDGGNGVVAVEGTVPALDKTVAGTDGAADAAMLRQEANSAIVRQRNNLAVVVRMYNALAVSLGVPTLQNNLGSAAATTTLSNSVTATTVVPTANVANSDLASKAAVDAALTALANDIATVAAKIDDVLFASTDERVAVTLVP